MKRRTFLSALAAAPAAALLRADNEPPVPPPAPPEQLSSPHAYQALPDNGEIWTHDDGTGTSVILSDIAPQIDQVIDNLDGTITFTDTDGQTITVQHHRLTKASHLWNHH